MEAMEAILSRKSVRSFTEQSISDHDLRAILKAAMSGPSATNARDWSFIAVRDRAMLNKMADANGRPAEPLRKANVGILVCGDLERAFKPAPEYWIIDCSIAAQNICIAAHALGLGSVWLGTWPQMERVEQQKELFGLPDSIVPHSVIALGYPKEGSAEAPPRPRPPKPEFEEDRVHLEAW